jgi:hypothetical protein
MDTPPIPRVFAFAVQQEVGLKPSTQFFFLILLANVFYYGILTSVGVDQG